MTELIRPNETKAPYLLNTKRLINTLLIVTLIFLMISRWMVTQTYRSVLYRSLISRSSRNVPSCLLQHPLPRDLIDRSNLDYQLSRIQARTSAVVYGETSFWLFGTFKFKHLETYFKRVNCLDAKAKKIGCTTSF